jgi:hypothetical protein
VSCLCHNYAFHSSVHRGRSRKTRPQAVAGVLSWIETCPNCRESAFNPANKLASSKGRQLQLGERSFNRSFEFTLCRHGIAPRDVDVAMPGEFSDGRDVDSL